MYLNRYRFRLVFAVILFGVAVNFGQVPAGAQQPGPLSFTDITTAAGIDPVTTGSHGAMFVDITGDGLPDLYLTYNNVRDRENGYRRNQFYRNLGGGRFVEEAEARGIGIFGGGTHGAAFGDLDNDGDYDLTAALTYKTPFEPFPAEPNRIYRNDGGFFVDATPPAMANYADYTRGILNLDFDGDGDLDVFAVNGDQGNGDTRGVGGPVDRNELYVNNGGFDFSEIVTGDVITAPSGQGGTDTDYDGDGDIDLLVSNRNGDIAFLRNDGATFTLVYAGDIGIYNVPPPPPNVYHRSYSGISSGDLDNDGDLDIIFIEQQLTKTDYRVAHVYHNVGGGVFSFRQMFGAQTPPPAPAETIFSGLTAGLADLDNDRDLDLVLPGYPVVLLNNGAGTFAPGPQFPGPASGFPVPDVRSVAFGDIDADGDLDFALTAKFGRPYLVRNNFNGGQWLKVGLLGPQGQMGAFGAKIKVFAPGTSTLIGYREVKSSTGYLGQDDPTVHFGLGSASLVDVQVTYLNRAPILFRNVSSRQTFFLDGFTVLTAPGAPANFTATVAGSAVSLNWSAPAGGGPISEYTLEAGSAPGGTDIASLSVGNSTSFGVGAPPGVYYVRVRARNLAGQGSASTELIVRVGGACAGPPGMPATLNAAVNGFGVTLNWGAPTGGEAASAFVVEVGSASGLTDLTSFDTTATSLSAVGPAGTYFVRVRARNACGFGPASNEVVVALGCQGAPGAPTNLTSNVSGSSVTLNWIAGAASDTYELEVGFTPGATDLVIPTGSSAPTLSASAPPGTYFVRVRGRNACGTSTVSNEVAVVVN
jgi:hypothetical protein